MTDPDPAELRDLRCLPDRRPPADRPGPRARHDTGREVGVVPAPRREPRSCCSSATSSSTSRASTGRTSTAARSTACGSSPTSSSGWPRCTRRWPRSSSRARSPSRCSARSVSPCSVRPCSSAPSCSRSATPTATASPVVVAVATAVLSVLVLVRLAGIVGHLARDIERRTVLEAQLSYQAFHDPLTGLANRRRFIEAVSDAIATKTGTAVLFIDLDDFKHVNDQMGHDAGDALLTAVGHRLLGAIRPNDLGCRIGGDEFAVLLPDTFRMDEGEGRRTPAPREPWRAGPDRGPRAGRPREHRRRRGRARRAPRGRRAPPPRRRRDVPGQGPGQESTRDLRSRHRRGSGRVARGAGSGRAPRSGSLAPTCHLQLTRAREPVRPTRAPLGSRARHRARPRRPAATAGLPSSGRARPACP